jgi:hypothetical protein
LGQIRDEIIWALQAKLNNRVSGLFYAGDIGWGVDIVAVFDLSNRESIPVWHDVLQGYQTSADSHELFVDECAGYVVG